MLTVQTRNLDLTHFTVDSDPTRDVLADWPVYRDRGAASVAVVYFELAPGKHLGEHTDSAEELLVVLEGEVDAVVGSESRRVSAGGMALVPAQAPHDVRNAGSTTAKVVGVFSSNTIVSVFDQGFGDGSMRVVGTPMPEEAVPAS